MGLQRGSRTPKRIRLQRGSRLQEPQKGSERTLGSYITEDLAEREYRQAQGRQGAKKGSEGTLGPYITADLRQSLAAKLQAHFSRATSGNV